MRIRTFGKYLEVEHLMDYTLRNTKLVIDASNFFYKMYRISGLQFIFGCECDNLAEYLRNYLDEFKKANVQCYFVFKGGHQNIEKRLNKKKFEGRDFIIGNENMTKDPHNVINPIFMLWVCLQVLDEMHLNYTLCEFESKKECIALAQKFGCPILSFDVELALSGVPYIPTPDDLSLKEKANEIECKIFLLDNFLRKLNLTKEKLAIFVALTDENVFPENHFLPFFKSLKIPLSKYKRNIGILKWLGNTTRDRAVAQIFRHSNLNDKPAFLAAEKAAHDLIKNKQTPGIPTEYLGNGNKIDISDNDPQWFQKGVASKRIPIPLINVARSRVVKGSFAIADYKTEDPMLLSMDIIKYAYNLLTNFERKELAFYSNEELLIISTDNIEKPNYEANCSPFENGWNNLPKLFDHFMFRNINENVPDALGKMPEDIRLLMMALIYFSTKKENDVSSEVFSVLLSYFALNILNEVGDNHQNQIVQKLNENDRLTARKILMKNYATVGEVEAKKIFNEKWLHLLVEFYHCLENLNFLNTLCGSPYQPTVYSRTINASLIYKTLFTIRSDYEGRSIDFLKQVLNPAPTAVNFMLELFSVYKNLI